MAEQTTLTVGFTGTQRGMTEPQMTTVGRVLAELHACCTLPDLADRPDREQWACRAVHGDCIGADATFHMLAVEAEVAVAIRPAHGTQGKRAWCTGAAVVHPPKMPLDRNLDIVADADILVATPAQDHEIGRSGTWATIREARRRNVPRIIVWPDGTITNERKEA